MSTVAPGPPPESPPTEQDAAGSAQADNAAPAVEGRTCSKCGSPLAPGQDWCLECGAAAPGALGPPMWRSTGAVFAVLGVLAIGTAAAAVAALNEHTPARKTVTTLVAHNPTPPAATPPATTPTPAPLPQGSKQSLPHTPAKLPKIPLTPSTTTPVTPPAATNTTPSTGTGSSETSSGETGTSGKGSEGGSEGNSSSTPAILLDTDAASTYNPYNYPAGNFGDPSLTIDGDHSTAWTAQVE